MSELTFHYRNRPWTMIGGIIVGTTLCAAMLDMAFGVFTMPVHQSTGLTIFFTVSAILSAALAGLGMFGFSRSFCTPRKIILGRHGVSAPKAPIRLKTIEVPYSDIVAIKTEDIVFRGILRDIIMTVVYEGGVLRIPKSCLADQFTFERIREALNQRVLGSTAPESVKEVKGSK